MGIFNFKFNRKEEKKEQPKKQNNKNVFQAFNYSAHEQPKIIEKPSIDWVLYGEDNMYPQHLNELVKSSSIQNAIIIGKAKMMAGAGLLLNGAKTKEESDVIYNSLPLDQKLAYDNFLNNPYGTMTLNEVREKCSDDYERYGAYAMEVIWNIDFTKIAKIKYVEVANLRCGKIDDDIITEFYYSRNWKNYKKKGYEPILIKAFNPKSKELYDKQEEVSYNQIIYVKNGNLEYYGEPLYESALNYVNIDVQMSIFHLSNIQNGFNPSLAIKIYNGSASDEERYLISKGIQDNFASAKNAGRAMIFFSDDKETATDVEPIPVSNLDKQFMEVANQAVQQILTGNRVTSPLLFGISTPGQLGGNTELKTAYEIFDLSVVEPDRNAMEKTLNKILAINIPGLTVEIEPFNPLINIQ